MRNSSRVASVRMMCLAMILFAFSATHATTTTPPVAPTPSASNASLAPGFPPQPEGVPFPADDWMEGDLPDGIDRAALDAVIEESFNGGVSPRVRAVVIIHGGRLVYERYSPNPDDTRFALMPSQSIAKSVTSALAGILVRDGRLDVYAPAAIPAWDGEGDPRAAITLDDLLRMSSGLEWDEIPYPEPGDMTNMIQSDDAAAYAADKPLIHPPGTEYLYNSGNTMLVSRVMADIVGEGAAFRRFMVTELFSKIGIIRFDTLFDRAGTWFGSFAIETTARNYARLGLLYLRDGVWDGERILPEGWVDYTRTPSEANPEYGAGWWLDTARPGVFYAVGVRGQVIAVDPAHDLTFVHLATDSATAYPVGEAILNAFAAGDLTPDPSP